MVYLGFAAILKTPLNELPLFLKTNINLFLETVFTLYELIFSIKNKIYKKGKNKNHKLLNNNFIYSYEKKRFSK